MVKEMVVKNGGKKCGLAAIMAFVGAFLMTNFVMAANDSIVDEIGIFVPISCTMSSTGMTSHNAEIANGVRYGEISTDLDDGETTYDGIGTTTLHAFCNDNEGFSIYAAGYTNDEVGGINSTKLVGTSASNYATIETGGDLGNTQDVSDWVMAVYSVSDSGDTTGTNAFTIDNGFKWGRAVPSAYTKVAHKNSSTSLDITTGGVKLGTTYLAYISSTQPADTYSGQVIYTLVHPASEPAPVFCKPSGTTISTIDCMQDVTATNKSTILSSMTEDQQYTLKDKRDGKVYTVAKLKDGNIWMTQNLDLDLNAGKTYTNLDTDLGWNGTSYSTASWTPVRSTYSSNNKTWCEGGTWNMEHGYCENNYTPESYDPGDLYWNGVGSEYDDWDDYFDSCTWENAMHEAICDESLNPTATYTTVSGTPIQQYHLGNYYNWNAAVAMNDTNAYATQYQEADQSICPVGWTLPKSGNSTSSGSFYYLFNQYGWNSSSFSMTDPYIWDQAIKMIPSGDWFGLMDCIGGDGNFWSSTISNSTHSYHAEISFDGYVSDNNGYDRFFGQSVRCVAR